MATLRERKTYREQVLRVLYEAVEGNRLLGITGAQLRRDLHVPEQDLAAACTYLAGERLINVDWGPGNTPRDGHPYPRGNPAHGGRGGRDGHGPGLIRKRRPAVTDRLGVRPEWSPRPGVPRKITDADVERVIVKTRWRIRGSTCTSRH